MSFCATVRKLYTGIVYLVVSSTMMYITWRCHAAFLAYLLHCWVGKGCLQLLLFVLCTVFDNESPKEVSCLWLLTTGTYRYQDRWQWFLLASRSSLYPPGPRAEAQNLLYGARKVEDKIQKHPYCTYVSLFKGPCWRGRWLPSTVSYVYSGRCSMCLLQCLISGLLKIKDRGMWSRELDEQDYL